jgi:hypothetical protein
MKTKHVSVIAITAALALWLPAQSLAQPTSLPPPRTHSGPTMMGAKARSLQTQVAQEIEKAKAAGTDVSSAEQSKEQGDAALKAGHYRIAVAHYETAQKALPAK